MNTDIRDIRIGKAHAMGNQMSLQFNYTFHTFDWDCCRMVKYERQTNFNSFYPLELLSMYHNLAKKCNEIFGTAFTFSQEVIDKVKFQLHDLYNISHEYDWDLRDNGHAFEILHHYWFEGHSKTEIGLSGISTATYGEYDRDSIISLTEALRKSLSEIKTEYSA